MRNFFLGVITIIVATAIVAAIVIWSGFFPTHANAKAPGVEEWIASAAMDASMDRHAPHIANPVPATDENLIDGMKIYTMNCALCHGNMDLKPSELEHSFYPPPPQLILQPLDDPEWHIGYAIRTGVRYTGMPAWQNVLSDQDIWKVTAFLSHVEKLPPAAQDYWRKAYGVSPESHPSDQEQHSGHHH